jgi:hypothetical protein
MRTAMKRAKKPTAADRATSEIPLDAIPGLPLLAIVYLRPRFPTLQAIEGHAGSATAKAASLRDWIKEVTAGHVSDNDCRLAANAIARLKGLPTVARESGAWRNDLLGPSNAFTDAQRERLHGDEMLTLGEVADWLESDGDKYPEFRAALEKAIELAN